MAVSVRDVLIVGAGPSGLATAIACRHHGLDYRRPRTGRPRRRHRPLPAQHGVLHHARAAGDRRRAADLALREADAGRSAALLPQGHRHLPAPDRALRAGHWRSSATATATTAVFVVATRSRLGAERVRHARAVVLAMGYYDRPNLLGVPGEDLPHVSHYYSEPHPYYRRAGGRGRRQELGVRSGARPLPQRRARHARASRRGARRLGEVLGAARHGEPHQGRRRWPRTSTPASSRSRPTGSSSRPPARARDRRRCACCC